MQFYYADGDQQKGPVDLATLQAARITPQTLVWREGMAEWLPASRVPELASILAAPASPAYAPPAAQSFSPAAPPQFHQPSYPTAGVSPMTPQTPYAAGQPQNLQYGGYGNTSYNAGYTQTPSQGMSIASLVLGILAIPSTFCYGSGFLFALLAIIFGHIGHSQSKRQTGRANGMAVAGLVCGYASLAIVALVFLFVFMLIGAASSGGRGGF